MNDNSLSKVDLKLIRRVWDMTVPYWLSSGPNQKWYLLGFLSLVGVAGTMLYVLYSFMAQGALMADLVPSAVSYLATIAGVTAALFSLGLSAKTRGRILMPALLGLTGLAAMNYGAIAGPDALALGGWKFTAFAIVSTIAGAFGLAGKHGLLPSARGTTLGVLLAGAAGGAGVYFFGGGGLEPVARTLLGVTALSAFSGFSGKTNTSWLAYLPVAIVAALFGVEYLNLAGVPTAVASWLPANETLVNHRIAITAVGVVIALGLPTFYLRSVRNVMDRGWRLLGILIALMFSVNGLNVLLSYLNRDMMNSLQEKAVSEFWIALIILGSVFILGIPIVVCYRWVRDELGNAWRNWMTDDIMTDYMGDGNRPFYRISQLRSVDNPDQRITEDPRYFAAGALSLLLVILDSILTVSLFFMVLWSISHLLSGTVLLYALVGTVVTVLFGKRLIGFEYRQEEFEANLRFQAGHVRKHAEAIAFFRGERMELKGLRARLADAIENYSRLIRWQRNLGFFTQGYQYLVIVLPTAIMAPLFFNGHAQFGQIMQASSAFSQILDALSLFILSFKTIAGFAANVNRLAGFREEIERPDPSSEPGRPRIGHDKGETIEVEDVTLHTPNYKDTLVTHLNTEVKPGESLLIMGPSGSGKSSILRMIAGLWRSGSGNVTTPDITDMMFMPQEPYLPIGSLRWQLTYPDPHSAASIDELRAVLKEVNLPDLIDKAENDLGGIDNEAIDWATILSGGERQRVAMARLLLAQPKYAIIDEATSALDVDNEAHVYALLQGSKTTYISVGHRPTLRHYHDKVLVLDGKGGWAIVTPEEIGGEADIDLANLVKKLEAAGIKVTKGVDHSWTVESQK